MSTMPNRSGRLPGQKYIIFPDPRGIRAWWVADNGQLERGPSGLKPRNLRNMLTRQGMKEVGLDEVVIAAVKPIAGGERL